MKEFHCGSLVPGCHWHSADEDTAELVKRAIDHMKTAHGDRHVGPSLVARIRQNIHEQEEDRPVRQGHIASTSRWWGALPRF